jgi:hypothetical protein
MAQYKANCTGYKKGITAIITEVTSYMKKSSTTATHKKICETLVTAMKKCLAAFNKCDPNCSCKGKTPDAGMKCFTTPVANADKAINAYNTAMQKTG